MTSITFIERKVFRFQDGRNYSNILFLVFFTFIFSSCEQRDPQAEYEDLLTTVFNSPQEGEAAAQKYLDDFHGKKDARIQEVKEIRNQYILMINFFSNSFSSYCDFIKQGKKHNDKLSNSIYPCVRDLWQDRYGKERDRLLEPLMESITESDFEAFFKTQVRILSEKEFSTFVWNIGSIDQVSINPLTCEEDRAAKKANGEYRIHVSTGWGKIQSVGIISIEGIIGFDESCNRFTKRTGYQVVKKP